MSFAEPPILETLSNIEGFDAVAGLKYVGGRESLYLQVIIRFVAMYGQNQWPPPTATSAEGLRAAAHHLRGAASTIGAIQVASLSGELQKASTPDSDPITRIRMTAELQRALILLVEELRRRLG